MQPNCVTAQPTPLPHSGQIIGALVEALGLDEEELSNRTAKRFFVGQSVTEFSAIQIYRALGRILVKSGVLPVPHLFEAHGVSMPVIAGATLAMMATKWDRLCGTLQSRSGPILRTDEAATGFLRLAVVDIALRAFALLRLAGLPPPEDATPLWAEKNGAGEALRRLLADAGLTRDQAAARIGVTYTSVDNWLDGKVRPSAEHLQVIAREVSRLLKGGSEGELLAYLHRQFTLSAIADSLAHHIGRDSVKDLARALCRLTKLITEDVAQMNRPPVAEDAGEEMEALRLGTDSPSSLVLLRNLALVESDPEWRRDICAACLDWGIRFQEIAGQSGYPRLAAGLAQDLTDLESSNGGNKATQRDEAEQDLKQLLDTRFDPEEYLRPGLAGLAMLQQVFSSGLADRQWIVARHPLSSQAHFQLGSFLGMMGKWLGKRGLVEEGVTECKIAAALREDWDAPRVEVGIILGNAGRYQEALAALEEASEKLQGWTPHLAFSLGYVRMQLGQTREALEAFEYVIGVRPDYALALNYAAHCCLELGETAKGQRLAKRARHLGEDGAYLAWRRGAYARRDAKKA